MTDSDRTCVRASRVNEELFNRRTPHVAYRMNRCTSNRCTPLSRSLRRCHSGSNTCRSSIRSPPGTASRHHTGICSSRRRSSRVQSCVSGRRSRLSRTARDQSSFRCCIFDLRRSRSPPGIPHRDLPSRHLSKLHHRDNRCARNIGPTEQVHHPAAAGRPPR